MNWERKNLQLCAWMIGMAVVLRLGSAGAFGPVVRWLGSREMTSFLVYAQTGRMLRTTPPRETAPAPEVEPEEPTAPRVPAPAAEVFSEADLEFVRLTDQAGKQPDLGPLLTQDLELDLKGRGPRVLILHTHATECYTRMEGEDYVSSGAYRTADTEYNMVCLGELVAQRLVAGGIGVIHDRALHDHGNYEGAYAAAAESTQALLEQYPTIRLVLDLHRDAADTPYGQLVTECSIGSKTSAQLMIVVGTDGGGLDHPRWQENLALGLKLQAVLERENPGLMRPILLSPNRYNQQLGAYALIVEIGAAGNTMAEAALAAEKLAAGILALNGG